MILPKIIYPSSLTGNSFVVIFYMYLVLWEDKQNKAHLTTSESNIQLEPENKVSLHQNKPNRVVLAIFSGACRRTAKKLKFDYDRVRSFGRKRAQVPRITFCEHLAWEIVS